MLPGEVGRLRIAFERLKLGQCQLVRLCAFKVGRSGIAFEALILLMQSVGDHAIGRSVITFERSKFLYQRGKAAAAHGLEPGSIALERSKPWYQPLLPRLR